VASVIGVTGLNARSGVITMVMALVSAAGR